LLDAYARYRRRSRHPLALVLAGRARASGEGVRVSASPAAAELAALYADAVALVHPSLYEGFGLTPLEAMRLGTPVIAARSPGVAEVCGEAAAYVPPSDPERLAHAMRELAGDRDRRAELARRGRERAEAFSWAGCAERHRAAYSLALGRPSR
jgi:glycosyltransferase involved in cell wall biosynthesis